MGQLEQNQFVDELLTWSRDQQETVKTRDHKERLVLLERSLLNLQKRNAYISSEEIMTLSKRANELYREFNHDDAFSHDENIFVTDKKSNVVKRKETEGKRVPIGEHRLPPLPYAYNALLPYIDEEIMRLHHAEHHKSYVDGLNKAEKEMEKARQTGNFDLIKHWEREAAFHGAGHYLHTIFWNVMSPKGGGHPKGALSNQIDVDFGSFDNFKEHFSEAAKNVEAVGWAILVWAPRARRLEILQAEKHQNLSQWDVTPILPLDVWEHAYYLQYKNKRDLYVDNWWNVVNWDHANERFLSAQQIQWEPF
ncbi:superoxide dismutase [Anaerobacillus isosaccharinicus]|uniref:superoxide dismutase n=1 Tax=Anaerobacillus isosaccharinicus TaxID=1532552 RepID=A0A1S2M4F6_9BACI|nr:superoxide dismutase [Anaerobacillus isosaccharinicus]MBA5585764.1 superoxide dismutase [Anaerobacillus isosaccharinicus]QOY35936.1 superoxide dismutase [Anaerobacillus isosaccharinicus]